MPDGHYKGRAMENLTCDATGLDLKLGESEQAIALLWAEILQTTAVAKPTDNFFELGGSSIDMVMLLFRIQEEFSIELDDGEIFQAPSLREMAAVVEAAYSKSRIEAVPHVT